MRGVSYFLAVAIFVSGCGDLLENQVANQTRGVSLPGGGAGNLGGGGGSSLQACFGPVGDCSCFDDMHFGTPGDSTDGDFGWGEGSSNTSFMPGGGAIVRILKRMFKAQKGCKITDEVIEATAEVIRKSPEGGVLGKHSDELLEICSSKIRGIDALIGVISKANNVILSTVQIIKRLLNRIQKYRSYIEKAESAIYKLWMKKKTARGDELTAIVDKMDELKDKIELAKQNIINLERQIDALIAYIQSIGKTFDSAMICKVTNLGDHTEATAEVSNWIQQLLSKLRTSKDIDELDHIDGWPSPPVFKKPVLK